jgi:hypothetical protein
MGLSKFFAFFPQAPPVTMLGGHVLFAPKTRVARLFLVQTKTGKNVPKWQQNHQMAIKYTKMAIKYQAAMKYTKSFPPKAFKNVPK